MKIPYFCCIGAELKRYAKDFDFMNQVYLYKVPTDDSIEEVLAEDYFKAISDSVLQDDLVYIYEASAETLHSCRFDKQNGHITAVPLASDETLTGAVTTIIHDNLTKNRAVISNNDGKIAVSEVTTTELGCLSGATSNIQEQLNEKAKTDLSNLTSTGKNISNWSNNVTNCPTETPQDIKLTLSNGTLTLISGSKLYLPNGVGVFDDYSTTQNYDTTQTNNGTYLVFFNGSSLFTRDINKCFSGTEPTPVQTYSVWYDTANNLIKYTTNSTTWQTGLYLPIAQVTVSDGAISSIDQVFNGFGYIYSTIFALPGVKGIIPNGLNADGSLKNALITTTKVSVYTVSNPSDAIYQLAYNGGVAPFYTHMTYNEKENFNSASGTIVAWGIIGTVTFSSGKITEFNPKTVFHAVDYNDTEYIGHQAMPSSRYIDLTLPAHGGYVTAPADGYVVMSIEPGISGQSIGLLNATAGDIGQTIYMGGTGRYIVHTHVSKGDTVQVYHYNSTPNIFRFTYDNGSK